MVVVRFHINSMEPREVLCVCVQNTMESLKKNKTDAKRVFYASGVHVSPLSLLNGRGKWIVWKPRRRSVVRSRPAVLGEPALPKPQKVSKDSKERRVGKYSSCH